MSDLFWTSVPNFPSYEISSTGVLMRRGEGDIRPSTYENGDLRWEMEEYEWKFRGPCWRVMLWSFYLGGENGMEPIFLDGDRTNHGLDNLEFTEIDRKSGDYRVVRWVQQGRYRRFDRRIGQRIKVNETGIVYNSIQEVADAVGGQKSNVSACLHGRLKSHRGKTFSYV